jgi:hypothetical protein
MPLRFRGRLSVIPGLRFEPEQGAARACLWGITALVVHGQRLFSKNSLPENQNSWRDVV